VKRIAVIATVLAASGLWAMLSAIGGTEGNYRVDAIFDNASNLIPGQDVKVAGARVGRVVGVKLTPDRKARVQMQIDPRFAPFRSDADCTIQPQSLIGEKFIQCTPGTTTGKPIKARGDQAPTVSVANTHAPVDLDLVFATFRLPYRERLQLIVSELGMGLAGRGEDLNDLIRRANPALQESRRVLRIVDGDRTRLRALIAESDHIVGELARRKGRVADFIDRAQRVAATTAQHRGALDQGIRRLPPLLSAAKPSLDRLRTLADTATPVLAQLRGAAPSVNRLVGDLPPLADAARPALKRLGSMADTGIDAVRQGRPVVAQLRAFAAAARPTGALVNELFSSLRQRGVVEGLQRFVYYGATATSRFDRYSHMLPAHLIVNDCSMYATKPVAGCDAHFGDARGAGEESERSKADKHRSKRHSRTRTREAGRDGGAQPAPAPSGSQPAPAAPTPSAPATPSAPMPSVPTPTVPQVPAPPSNPTEPVKKVLDWLLGQ
jgi:phospholipid/cholesterol/gamma-HCH transport system substrate-binding protein